MNARVMLHRYHTQETQLKQGIALMYSRGLAKAVQAWEFEETHTLLLKAQQLLLKHRDDAAELKILSANAEAMAADAEASDVALLRDAVCAWSFADDPEIQAAREVLRHVEPVHAAAIAQAQALQACEWAWLEEAEADSRRAACWLAAEHARERAAMQATDG